jgi:ECF sigma factor
LDLISQALAGGFRCHHVLLHERTCAQPGIREARRGERVSLDGIAADAGRFELSAMDEAIKTLSKFDPRKAQVVELRYFGGLTFEETVEALAISPETAKRDWKVAKACCFGSYGPNASNTFPATPPLRA